MFCSMQMSNLKFKFVFDYEVFLEKVLISLWFLFPTFLSWMGVVVDIDIILVKKKEQIYLTKICLKKLKNKYSLKHVEEWNYRLISYMLPWTPWTHIMFFKEFKIAKDLIFLIRGGFKTFYLTILLMCREPQILFPTIVPLCRSDKVSTKLYSL